MEAEPTDKQYVGEPNRPSVGHVLGKQGRLAWDPARKYGIRQVQKIWLLSRDIFIQSYQNFRSLMQYIDFALMDVHTLQYNCRELAASFIYLILNLKLHVFAQEDVVNTFPKTSKYMLNQTDLNNFYCSFLERSFGFALIDLLPTVQYCATFCFLPIDMSLPPSMVGIEDSEQVEYE